MQTILNKNKYKTNIITEVFKKKNLFIFKSNTLSELEIKRISKKSNLSFYKLKTNLAKKVLNKSSYHNFLNLLEGQIVVAYQKNALKELDLKKIIDIDSNLIQIAFKLDNKFYSNLQLENNKSTYLTTHNSNINYLLSTKKKLKIFIHTLNLIKVKIS